MPEYLAPGVYVEETSFRAKSIEGVSTSIAGMIGPARFGPTGGEPEILTAFTEFERMYGGIDAMRFVDSGGAVLKPVPNYLAFAARAFFENGGTKLYVSRIMSRPAGAASDYGVAKLDVPAGAGAVVKLRSRFPGESGNMQVGFRARVAGNVLYTTKDSSGATVTRVRLEHGDVVFIARPPAAAAAAAATTVTTAAADYGFFTYDRDNAAGAQFVGNTNIALSALDPANDAVLPLTVEVQTCTSGRFDDPQQWGEFALNPKNSSSLTAHFHPNPDSKRRRVTLPLVVAWPTQNEIDPRDLTAAPDGHAILAALMPNLRNAVQLNYEVQARRIAGPPATPPDATAMSTIRRLIGEGMANVLILSGGIDGLPPTPSDYEGEEIASGVRTGLLAFEDVEDISIIAAPAYAAQFSDTATRGQAETIQNLLISHAEKMRYRIAVLDSGPDFAISEVREQRGAIDSKYAAMYYPWIRVIDPLAPRGASPANQELLLPPSGFVAGIFARNDVERGVHKTPANEVVRGALGFEFNISKSQQDVLNPDGVNAFRFFEGRGNRLWGGRTASSDPEWKYVGVRRFFQYLERSIERGTQWAVFENNNDRLWANIKRTIEDFLYNEWNNGALMGLKPEEAYWVRCDRTTMTQNDIDNGRLVCLIGVSPNKPAEFVVFRIGQWTADRKA